MADLKRYGAAGVTVTFDPARCLHAARCVQGLPEVFDTTRRPWIAPERASVDAVAQVVRRCPSGALHYELDDGPPEEPTTPTQISARPNEPLWLRGDLQVATGAGVVSETRVALCTCGATANSPFCDSSGDCEAWRQRVAELDG